MNFQKKFSDYLKRLEWRGKMVNKKAIKAMGKKTFKAVTALSGGCLEGLFILPSFCRKIPEKKYGKIEMICYIEGGTIALLGALMGEFNLWPYHEKFAISLLTAQITTNLCSGIYEWYRYEKNKALSPKNKPKESGLEEAVKTPEVEIKPPINPKDYKNPFEYEIPKNA